MAKRKKTFPCGHKGRGKSCKLCQDIDSGRLVAVQQEDGSTKYVQIDQLVEKAFERPVEPEKGQPLSDELLLSLNGLGTVEIDHRERAKIKARKEKEEEARAALKTMLAPYLQFIMGG